MPRFKNRQAALSAALKILHRLDHDDNLSALTAAEVSELLGQLGWLQAACDRIRSSVVNAPRARSRAVLSLIGGNVDAA